MPRYDYLFIDLDDTLLDFNMSEKNAFKNVCKEFNIPFTDALYKTYHDVNLSYWKKYERKEVVKEYFFPQRFTDAFHLMGYQVDGASLNKRYVELLSDESHLFPGALEFVQAASKLATLFICSNGDAYAQHKRIGVSPIRPYFAKHFVSEEIGYQKPNPHYYDPILACVKDKSRCLAIGDSKTSDIQGGINIGIDTCFFSPSGEDHYPEILPTYSVRGYDEILEILRL